MKDVGGAVLATSLRIVNTIYFDREKCAGGIGHGDGGELEPWDSPAPQIIPASSRSTCLANFYAASLVTARK